MVLEIPEALVNTSLEHQHTKLFDRIISIAGSLMDSALRLYMLVTLMTADIGYVTPYCNIVKQQIPDRYIPTVSLALHNYSVLCQLTMMEISSLLYKVASMVNFDIWVTQTLTTPVPTITDSIFG